MTEYKVLIGGKWVDASSKIEVLNPYNQKPIALVPNLTISHLNLAIESAKKASQIMKQLPSHQRSKILENTSLLIGKKKDELAKTITLEGGKPISLSYKEVFRAQETFKFASELTKHMEGEVIPMDASTNGEERLGFTLKEPLGIIGAISPFNFPLNLVAHKVAPAIATGNAVVLKPATYTPITAIKLGEILLEAGLPPGGLNIITGRGEEIGDPLVKDERIAKITFTGSPEVGKRIATLIGMKRLTLELGSNSAVIIDNIPNFLPLISRLTFGSFAHAGQVCISVQRIYVHTKIFTQFLEEFIKETKKVKIGNPFSREVIVGPMITPLEAERVESWVTEAIEGGANLLIGGKHTDGIFMPTVITNTKKGMKVVDKEIFGPVVIIEKFDEWEEGIKLVNQSEYGLQAGVYTEKINKILYAIEKLDVGGVIINDIPTYRVDHIPYGGVKQSGMGREGVKYAMEEMVRIKFVCVNKQKNV